ncbi:MAG: peptidoglycan-binding protein [Clostridia bacterium]|nr:peptidoglycan-binding protein [Clostridia bacterium]
MAYYSLDEQEKAIIQIQRLLRELDYQENQLARVRLNGIYDDETREAVRNLQEKYSLPITGIVDHTTWQVLQAVAKAQREANALARAIYILPRNEEYTIYPGLRDDVIYVIQHLLNVIGQEYVDIGKIPFSGVYDEATVNAIRAFQRKQLLDANGIINPATFNSLAGEYERINSYNQ